MKVKHLLEVLKDVDPELELYFTYDSRAASRKIHSVDIETYCDNKPVICFREEDTEEYSWYSFHMSVEEYKAKLLSETCPEYWKQSYPTEELWLERQMKEVLYYEKDKKNFEENYVIQNLYVEDEDE